MPSDPTPNQQPNSSKNRRRPAPAIGGNWIWLVVLVVLALFLMASPLSTPRQIHWSEFVYLLEHDAVEKVVQVGDRYDGVLLKDWEEKLDAAAKEAEKDSKKGGEPPELRKDVKKAIKNYEFSVDRLQGSDQHFQQLLADKVSKGKVVVYSKPTYTGWINLLSIILPA